MRRTVEAPYSRGEATRARILDVAVDLFGTKGFDRVSTREIASGAEVPQASLRYYFETKQGLYVACLEYIQARIYQQMEPALERAEQLLADRTTSIAQLIDSFCSLQDAMVDAMIGADDSGTAAWLLVRHDLPSEGGAGALSGDESDLRRMASCFAGMLMRISADRLDQQSASRIAGLINGQITNVYLRRNRLLEEGWDLTTKRVLWIKDMIRMHTMAILQAHGGQTELSVPPPASLGN